MTSGEHEIWTRLRAVEHEASAARQLAAAAYEEVGSLAAGVRANTSLLNALRETQVEQGARLGRVETRLESVDARLGSVETRLESLDARLGSVETRLESVETGLESVDGRLVSLESAVNGLDSRVGGLEAKVDGLEAKVDGLESEVRAGFAMVGQGMATLTAMVERLKPTG